MWIRYERCISRLIEFQSDTAGRLHEEHAQGHRVEFESRQNVQSGITIYTTDEFDDLRATIVDEATTAEGTISDE